MATPKKTDEISEDTDSLESLDEPTEMMENLHLSSSATSKHLPSPTVRRAPGADRSPTVRRTTRKRRSSSMKQPLALDLSFGNSPSAVRQFRRVSDKVPVEPSSYSSRYSSSVDENTNPKTAALHSGSHSKEAQLGRRAYSKAVGLACQEILGTTGDQEKREAISRLAEAWSDLEMIDPEGLCHIIKTMNEKLQGYVYPIKGKSFSRISANYQSHISDPKLSALVPKVPSPESPQKPRLVLAQNNPHLKSHRRRQSIQAAESNLSPSQLSNLPGQHVPGMEHTRQLSEVLYQRWSDGLRNRWPGI